MTTTPNTLKKIKITPKRVSTSRVLHVSRSADKISVTQDFNRITAEEVCVTFLEEVLEEMFARVRFTAVVRRATTRVISAVSASIATLPQCREDPLLNDSVGFKLDSEPQLMKNGCDAWSSSVIRVVTKQTNPLLRRLKLAVPCSLSFYPSEFPCGAPDAMKPLAKKFLVKAKNMGKLTAGMKKKRPRPAELRYQQPMPVDTNRGSSRRSTTMPVSEATVVEFTACAFPVGNIPPQPEKTNLFGFTQLQMNAYFCEPTKPGQAQPWNASEEVSAAPPAQQPISCSYALVEDAKPQRVLVSLYRKKKEPRQSKSLLPTAVVRENDDYSQAFTKLGTTYPLTNGVIRRY